MAAKRTRWLLGLTLAALAVARPAASQTAPVDSAGRSFERALVEQGLENVTVAPGAPLRVAFEDRRDRHVLEGLGRVRAAAGQPFLGFVRRRGMAAAAITTDERDSLPRFRVHFPSDPDFPAAPEGPRLSSTSGRIDLELGLQVEYRVGQILGPLEWRVDLEPRMVVSPWPGASLRAGVLLPVYNDFPLTGLQPDIERVRPGRVSLDQFTRISKAALLSFSGGYFGDHRWGGSIGAARPLWNGSVLLDAQLDQTGFLAFPEGGTQYSSLDRTSGFGGVSYQPPGIDLAMRLRVAHFLYGDNGVDFEMRRTFGDLEVAPFIQRTAEVWGYGLRFDLPVPPNKRRSGSRVRIQPITSFPFSFRDRSEPIGTFVAGVASRREYLRQLSGPGLDVNAERYRHPQGVPRSGPADPTEWVSFTGMSGFINTPWAGVMADRGFEAGYNSIPKRWAWDNRGRHDNQVFYNTLGFLPRLEGSMRWTRILGYRAFEEVIPDSRLADVDRMASGRLEILHPVLDRRPGLAVGVEDVEGTRRFHSAYAVVGMPFSILLVQSRASVGYGFRAFDADRYVLDGGFGAVECALPRSFRVQVEYDSEKWNAAAGLLAPWGFRLRAALLNLESASFGIGWSHSL